ncbi:nickel-dependent hydrogenase large subunit [Mobiluncus porci]|uniref:Reducing hydrogenase subunit alpha n=1 Tax=Mobiluncus porci TaxID=2652278 RepID=A0A7K0K495_9ACTO|nr:nickel-dependent hydrogenase large subunit [Mobiluncus porci]MST50296.1 reducing hydrogenase subunit alpha [Mobiluncus porci]
MKINIGEIIDPTEGRVVVEVDESGKRHARFDLTGLPRVEGLLVGKGAGEALKMTEHLCGICPVAHHLAGMRALDALTSDGAVSDLAEMVRRLLHYGSIVETHSLRFVSVDREAGIALKKFSKLMLVGAGSPGHFPVTARPGGVTSWPAATDLQAVVDGVSAAIDTAERVVAAFGETKKHAPIVSPQILDVALIDAKGNPDVFGTRMRVSRNGEVVEEFGFSEWNEKIAEEIPGSPAPRPYFVPLGQEAGRYRVGPVSQLSIGSLSTVRAKTAQARWLKGARDAAEARAIVTLHVLERTSQLVSELQQRLVETDAETVVASPEPIHAGTATGLVDGPRGILAHTYEVDDSGTITRSIILTPTAQNEPWLADLLTRAAETETTPDGREAALEDSIREADPCLPISSAPPGQMGLKLDIIGAE